MLTLQQLESDPEFARLSYQDQILVRSKWASKYLAEDEEFQSLSPQDRQVIIDQLIYRAPSTIDPFYGNRAKSVVQRVQSGDKQSQNFMLWKTVGRSFTDSSLLAKGAAFLGQYFDGSHGIADEVISQDALKETAYYDYLLSKDKQTSTKARLLKIGAGIVGMGLDMGVGYAVLAGSAAAPKLLAKVARDAVLKRVTTIPFSTTKNLVRFGQGLVSAIPNVTHAIAGGGLVGAVREPLMKLLDGAISGENPSLQELLLTSAKAFGSYAAGDLLFFTLGRPINLMLKNMKRTFVGKKFKGITGLTDDEIMRLMEDASSGTTFDQALLDRVNQVDPSGELHRTLMNARDKLALVRRLDELGVGTDEHKQAMAAYHGWSLDKVTDATGSNKWVASHLWKPEIKFNVGGDDAAGLFVLKSSLDPKQGLDDAFATDWSKRMLQVKGQPLKEGVVNVRAIRPEIYGSPGYPRTVNKKLALEVQEIEKFMFDEVAYMPEIATLQGGSGNLLRPMIPEYIGRAYFERAAQLRHQGTKLALKVGASFEDFRMAAEDLLERGFFGGAAGAVDKFGNTMSYFASSVDDNMWWKFAAEGDQIGLYSNYARLAVGNGMYDEAFISYNNIKSTSGPFGEATDDILKREGKARVVSETAATQMSKGEFTPGTRVPFGMRFAVTNDEAAYLLSRKAGNQKQFSKGFIVVTNDVDKIALAEGKSPMFSDKIVKFIPEGTADYGIIAAAKKSGTHPSNIPSTGMAYEGIAAIPQTQADIGYYLKQIQNDVTTYMKKGMLTDPQFYTTSKMASYRQNAIAIGADAFYDSAGSWYMLNPRHDIKFIDDAIVPFTSQITGLERMPVNSGEIALKAANDRFQKLTLAVEGIIGKDKRSRAVAIAQLLGTKTGIVPKKNLQLAAQLVGEQAGIPRGSLPVDIVTEAQYMAEFPSGARFTNAKAWYNTQDKKIFIAVSGDDVAARAFSTPQEQYEHMSTFFHEMAHAIQDYADANNVKLVGKFWKTRAMASKDPTLIGRVTKGVFNEAAAEKFAENLTATLKKYTVGSPGWLEWAVQKQGGRLVKNELGWGITRPGMNQATVYQNVDDVLKDVLLHDRDTSFITMSLRDQGKGILQVMSDADFDKAVKAGLSPNRYKVTAYLGKNPRVITEGNDLEKILTDVGWEPKISSALGPELAYVEDAARGKVVYNAGVVSGNYLDLLHHLNTFSSYSRTATKRLRVGNDGIISFLPGATARYEVRVPGIDDVRLFDTAKEAVEYLDEGWSKLSELKTTAMRKGYDLKMSAGGYHLWNGDDGTSITARNLPELQDALTKVKIPDWAPEMVGDYRGIEPMEYVEGTFMPSYFDTTLNRKFNALDPMLEFSHWFRPRDAYLESALRAKKITPELMQAFRNTQLARRASSGAMHEQATALVTILSKEGKPGTLLDEDRLVLIGRYMDNEATLEQLEALKRQLTPYELRAVEGLKSWFDNLFNKFGISDRKYVERYISHARRSWLSNKKLTSGTMADLLKKSQAPSNLSVFFENFRNEDIPNFLMEDNIFKVAMTYNAIGHRAQFLNPALKQLDQAMKNAIKDPNIGKNGAIWAISQYKDQLLGLYTANEEAVLRALEQFGKKVGFKDLSHMRDMYGAFYSVSYLATMGWRPYSAARNLMQIFQTLAPRFGNANTVKGLEYFDKNAEYIHNTLMKKGILTEYMPVFGSETMDITGKFSKVVHKGLSWFKNADDITRGIAWSTAKVQWDDALKNFKAMLDKGMSKDQATHAFMEISGLNLVAPDVRELAGKYLRGELGNPKGSFEAAFDVLAQEVIDTTMFAYQAGLQPSAYRGVVGKMFGMFGVYPAWYLENIRRGLSFGTTGQKAMFAARLAMNSAALWGSFALMGMNAKDFLPWVPVQFTGGPMYKIANQLLNAIGNDYSARQARAELVKSIPRTLIPGSMLFEHVMKAVKAAEEGDPWGVWLHLISAPVTPREARPKLLQ